ncbi:MAG: redoxin domain-containing protein [Candidatus Brocadiae bacterium]|nr:redoxin domain-containing protein [Candidatus Brocadiia bacterium]
MRPVLLAILAALTGCGRPGGAAPPSPEARGGVPAASPAPAAAPAWLPDAGAELIGTPARDFAGLTDWLNSPPLALADLRGRVALVRFWTSGCSLCTVSAPVLNDLDRRFRERGLVVIGVHHPKTRDGRDPARMRAAAERLGFAFPVAQDLGWDTVKAWWLDGNDRAYTSSAFLVDRDGMIRWVHPGGELLAGPGPEGDACRALESAIEAALGE